MTKSIDTNDGAVSRDAALEEAARVAEAYLNGSLRGSASANAARNIADAIRALKSSPDVRCVVPDGWKLVPVEPTKEMEAAMKPLMDGPPTRRWHWIWHELLTAAPSPQTKLTMKQMDISQNGK